MRISNNIGTLSLRQYLLVDPAYLYITAAILRFVNPIRYIRYIHRIYQQVSADSRAVFDIYYWAPIVEQYSARAAMNPSPWKVFFAMTLIVAAMLSLTAAQCTGCWSGTAGPCQAVNTVCHPYYAGTTQCPAGTVGCADASSAPQNDNPPPAPVQGPDDLDVANTVIGGIGVLASIAALFGR